MKKILVIITLSLFSGFVFAQNRSISIQKGEQPAAYVFENVKGEKKSFEEFKGKYILIDVWASWCSPCRKEFPALDSVRNHYADKDLVVIGISSDHIRYKWEGSLEVHKLPSPQWIIGEEKRFEEEFGITTIPRLILLGPDGKVVNERMPKPSNPEIYTILDPLLNK